MNHSKPLADLDARRRRLGMSAEILAQRSVLSRQTGHRVLAGGSASVQNVIAIADGRGMSHSFYATKSAPDIREPQARDRTGAEGRRGAGTGGLESQAVDQEHLDEMVRQTVHELLAGPNRRLWAA